MYVFKHTFDCNKIPLTSFMVMLLMVSCAEMEILHARKHSREMVRRSC